MLEQIYGKEVRVGVRDEVGGEGRRVQFSSEKLELFTAIMPWATRLLPRLDVS